MCEGRTFDFETGVGYGLVNELWETATHEEFVGKVMSYAHRFTPPGRATLAICGIKRAVQSGLEMSFEQGLALERELQAELFASEDAREGLHAYGEKRTPVFQGK